MGSTSNVLFNGTSRYSQDFQQVISRAVAIASLPMTILNDQRTQVTAASTALTGLDSKFQALSSSVDAINNAFGWASYQANVSDPSKLSVTLADGATEGDYSVNITRAGAYATSISHAAWSAGSDLSYQISLDGTAYDLHPADSSAASVAAAINQGYGDRVRATVVNVGSADSPDYRISLQSTQMENLAPDILLNGTGLQDQKVSGQTVQYVINNSGHTAESSSATLQIADGLAVTLASGATGSATIQVSRGSNALGNALANFANAYNQAVDELGKQHGTSAGALSGDSVVDQLSQALRTISTYDGQTGSIVGLASLGLDLGKDGHLTFDSAKFNIAAQDSGAIQTFFGSADGGGFLKLATDTMDTVMHTSTGLLPSAETLTQNQGTDLDARIADEQDRVDQLQTSLQEQMAAADALIASMEQQYNYITGMFEAMRVASEQYK